MSAMFYYLSGQLGRHTEKGEGLTLLYRNFLFKLDITGVVSKIETDECNL